MKSHIDSGFVGIIMLTYTGLDKSYDLAHYTTKGHLPLGGIRSDAYMKDANS